MLQLSHSGMPPYFGAKFQQNLILTSNILNTSTSNGITALTGGISFTEDILVGNVIYSGPEEGQ